MVKVQDYVLGGNLLVVCPDTDATHGCDGLILEAHKEIRIRFVQHIWLGDYTLAGVQAPVNVTLMS